MFVSALCEMHKARVALAIVSTLNSILPPEFRQAINRPIRFFFSSVLMGCFAMGLTLSLYVVYLHNVHHFSISFATLLLSLGAIIGLATSPLWGTLTDRIGPVPTMLLAGAGQAGALLYWAFIETSRQAIIGGLLLSFFGGSGWGPGSTLLTRLCPPEQRQRAYGFNFLLVNLGIGAGGLVSASIVNLRVPESFRHLYLLNVVVSTASALFFVPLWRYGQPQPTEHLNEQQASEGWGVVLRDKRLRRFVIASLFMMIGGYGSQEAGFSLFVVNNVHLSVHAIGVIFFFNTSTIVLAQLFIINRVQGRSRMRVLAVTSVAWATFWFILAAALALPKSLAFVALCCASVIFALGETLMSPIGSAFVNEIAPEHLRGRYNAANGLTWGVSSTLAPAIAGFYFDHGLSNWWPMATGLTALLGGSAYLYLRRSLTPEQDGRTPVATGA